MQRQNDIFYQNVIENIRNESSKLRTYSLLKTAIGKEKYLDRVRNVQNRVLLTKIRLSNHTLMIEKGRHLKIEKTQRFCKFCPEKIEDEYHFIMECKAYTQPRIELLQGMLKKVRTFSFLDKKTQFISILANLDVCNTASKHIRRMYEVRQFLIDERKNFI